MPNFVDDNTALAFPKSSVRVVAPGQEHKFLRAQDWNDACQAAYDMRSAIQALRAGSGITDNAVTLAKLAQIATATFLARSTAGTGNVEAITATQATALLNTFTTSAKGLVPAASGGSETTQFLRKDGTWATAGGTSITPVLSLTATGSNNTHSVNLSTLGNIDWFWMGNLAVGAIPRTHATPSTLHMKKTGPAWLWNGIDYAYGDANLTTFGQASSWRTITSTASDDTAQDAVSSLSAIGFHTPGGVTGWGFRFAVPAPADNIQRVLRIYGCQFSSVVTHSAVLTDGSATVASVTTDSTASTQLDFLTEVTYKAQYGGSLIVTCFTTTNHSAGASMRIQGGSIGTV